jgi:hypothetical protein
MGAPRDGRRRESYYTVQSPYRSERTKKKVISSYDNQREYTGSWKGFIDAGKGKAAAERASKYNVTDEVRNNVISSLDFEERGILFNQQIWPPGKKAINDLIIQRLIKIVRNRIKDHVYYSRAKEKWSVFTSPSDGDGESFVWLADTLAEAFLNALRSVH